MNEAEIRATFRTQHDLLSADYYSGVSSLTKEQFDLEHGQIWMDLAAELVAAGYATWPEPAFDAEAKIKAIKKRLDKLEGA